MGKAVPGGSRLFLGHDLPADHNLGQVADQDQQRRARHTGQERPEAAFVAGMCREQEPDEKLVLIGVSFRPRG